LTIGPDAPEKTGYGPMTTSSNASTPNPANPGGLVFHVQLSPPSLKDNRADADRLLQELQQYLEVERVLVDLNQMRRLPAILRQSDYRVRCLAVKEHGHARLIHVMPEKEPRTMAGLAIDLGTTRVAMRLIDLDGGDLLGETTFDNPQTSIGPDILTRVHYADQPEGRDDLCRLIRDAVNSHCTRLCHGIDLVPDDILLVAVAGNTTMSHLFAGLPVHWLIREPYIPATNRWEFYTARDMGLNVGPNARIFIFPNIGSYFGGDLIAGILYAGLHQRKQTAIMVDVGTNAEVVLGNRDWLIGCAGAAGPALESGMASMGTTAGPGVIDRVAIDPHSRRFDLGTIDQLPPRGICGSGVIDLAAQLFLSKMIDIRGKFKPDICGDRLIDKDGLAHLTVVPADKSATGRALTFSQAELDSLIRSKAAMYTILETLTMTVGLSMDQLETFFVAGTFGAYIDPASAIALGMIPDLPLERYQSLGNSSLGGATLVLTDLQGFSQAQSLQDRITYLELNVNQDFMNRFSAAKFIPHTDAGRFPSVIF
jgi:uncharacterized 2Fe-2S/4Fe-4S cluster protein (DUF4445 family)